MKIYLILILILFYGRIFSQWSDVGSGTNDPVNAFYVDSTTNLLYVGGEFDSVSNQNINKIAIWNGLNWNSFGNNSKFSTSSVINCITSFGGSIVIGGRFDSIGAQPVSNIAKWNGSTWEEIGDGFNDVVHSVIEYNGNLYAGGEFTFSGNQAIRGVARWDGAQWQPIATLIGFVSSMEIFQNNLIIAGGFSIPNTQISKIISWNGNSIDSDLVGFNDMVISVDCFDDTLYAVGSFTATPDNPCSYIAVYYNNDWHSIGHPVGGSNWVVSSAKYQNRMYFAGYFTNPPDLTVYNGTSFDSVGSCIGYFRRIIEYKGDMFLGGSFNKVEGISFNNIVKYNPSTIAIEEIRAKNLIEIFPNPTSGKVFINYNHLSLNKVKLEIYSFQGTLLGTEIMSAQLHVIEMDLFEPGIYICHIIESNELKRILKIVKL